MPPIEQFGPVIVVLGLLALTLWFLKRRGLAQFSMPFRGAAPARKRIEVLERLSLTAQHSVHLVRVADRVLLIGVAPNNCQLLSDHVDAATLREERVP